MLLALSLIACSLAAKGFQLQSRSIQSQAICSSDYQWAVSSTGQSPCTAAANVNALCNHGDWLIPALNASVVYDVPAAGGTASFCTCSWASYNLISACQACQGFDYEISSWSPYSINCVGLLSNTYFPANLTLPTGVLIPFWATTNPQNWTNQKFDPTAAKVIASQKQSDVGAPTQSVSATSSPSKSTPIGAIVGGVVGGVVVLLAGILVGICLIRRSSRTQHTRSNSGSFSMLMAGNTHLRTHSDMSTPVDYTTLSSSPMRPPTSPTIRTHATSSIRSFPFFSSGGSTVASPPSVLQQQPSMRQPPSVRQQSPPPGSVHRDETAVEPFVLPPSNTPNPDRKQANGAYAVFDPPSAPPPTAMRMEVQPSTPMQGGRAKYNPPAYTKLSPEAGGSTSRQVHAKKGSADTQHSITSSRSGGGGGATRAGGNMSAMGNVVSQITPARTAITSQLNPHDVIASANANTNTNAIPNGHGRQLSGNASNTSLNGKRRPTAADDGFTARDIA